MKTILVVDDDESMRDLLSDLIEDKGYRALKAASGSEALRIITMADPPKVDLVLLDYKMPDMNGVETLEHIKRIDEGVSVVLLSGYDKPPTKRWSGESGCLCKSAISMGLAALIKDLTG